MAGKMGVEPTTFGLEDRCSIHWATSPNLNWCQGVDLNHRPKAYESSALPLSYPGFLKTVIIMEDIYKESQVKW